MTPVFALSPTLGWALWDLSAILIGLAVWYFWGGRTIATYEKDE